MASAFTDRIGAMARLRSPRRPRWDGGPTGDGDGMGWLDRVGSAWMATEKRGDLLARALADGGSSPFGSSGQVRTGQIRLRLATLRIGLGGAGQSLGRSKESLAAMR